MTQKELANILKIDQTAVHYWEKGTTSPDVTNQKALAKIFGVSIDYLLGATDNPLSAGAETEPYSDDAVKFALYGQLNPVTDAQFEEVKRLVQLQKERNEHK
jgi:transcriptional regulator with XRE-family HTH domain